MAGRVDMGGMSQVKTDKISDQPIFDMDKKGNDSIDVHIINFFLLCKEISTSRLHVHFYSFSPFRVCLI